MEQGALVKAFRLLEAFGQIGQALPLVEVASRAGLVKPTAHRILMKLGEMGYVQRVGPGRYALTGKLAALVGESGVEQAMMACALPILQRLHERTDETVNLGVLRGERVVYRVVLESGHALRRVLQAGDSDPFHSTALGRAIAAHLPVDRREALLLRANLKRRTPATVTDREQLRCLLEQSRRRGYATERDENDVGMMCIAAALHGGVEAAVSVSVPWARMNKAGERRIRLAVVDAAAAIDKAVQTMEVATV